MKKLTVILILLFTVSLFAQDKTDSTLFKKYFADIKTLQETAQKLDKDKYEFLGKYFESMQNIQNQFQVVNMYLDEQRKKIDTEWIQKGKKDLEELKGKK